MTHDELLTRIKHYEVQPWSDMPDDKDELASALRAVVELHKPDESDFPDDYENCVECSGNGYVAMYPCQTIKIIEKELK